MANTAQTVEREAPQAAEVKWQKPSNFKRFLKRAWDCKILLAMLLPALTYVIIFSYIPMTGIVLAFKKSTTMSMVFTEARGSDSTTLSSSSYPTNSGR